MSASQILTGIYFVWFKWKKALQGRRSFQPSSTIVSYKRNASKVSLSVALNSRTHLQKHHVWKQHASHMRVVDIQRSILNGNCVMCSCWCYSLCFIPNGIAFHWAIALAWLHRTCGNRSAAKLVIVNVFALLNPFKPKCCSGPEFDTLGLMWK